MNCRDFERVWNERLDARDPAQSATARALDGHAASCTSCRAVGARYQALVLAIQSATATPAPPPGFMDRVLAAVERDDRPVAGRIVPRLARLAAAAAVVAAVAIGVRVGAPGVKRSVAPTTVARVRAIDPKDLTDALADASSATWDLAREASAPAARVGRQVLDSAELPGGSTSVSLTGGVRPAADVWRGVEDRVNAGVVPFEGTARHAFGFLLGAPPVDDAPPARPAEGA